MLSSTQNRIDTEISDLGKRIDAMSAMLNLRRQSLQQEYTAADLAMTQLKRVRARHLVDRQQHQQLQERPGEPAVNSPAVRKPTAR